MLSQVDVSISDEQISVNCELPNISSQDTDDAAEGLTIFQLLIISWFFDTAGGLDNLFVFRILQLV